MFSQNKLNITPVKRSNLQTNINQNNLKQSRKILYQKNLEHIYKSSSHNNSFKEHKSQYYNNTQSALTAQQQFQENRKSNQKYKTIKGQSIKKPKLLLNSRIEIIQNQASISKGDKYQCIPDILEFYLGESQKQDKERFVCDEIYEKQIKSIYQFTNEMSVGDYIIKLPNPSNVNKDYLSYFLNEHNLNFSSQSFDQFSSNQEGKNQNKNRVVEINCKQALQIYKGTFKVQDTSKSISKIKYEKKSFLLAFYLIGIDNYQTLKEKLRQDLHSYIFLSYFNKRQYHQTLEYSAFHKYFQQQRQNLSYKLQNIQQNMCFGKNKQTYSYQQNCSNIDQSSETLNHPQSEQFPNINVGENIQRLQYLFQIRVSKQVNFFISLLYYINDMENLTFQQNLQKISQFQVSLSQFQKINDQIKAIGLFSGCILKINSITNYISQLKVAWEYLNQQNNDQQNQITEKIIDNQKQQKDKEKKRNNKKDNFSQVAKPFHKIKKVIFRDIIFNYVQSLIQTFAAQMQEQSSYKLSEKTNLKEIQKKLSKHILFLIFNKIKKISDFFRLLCFPQYLEKCKKLYGPVQYSAFKHRQIQMNHLLMKQINEELFGPKKFQKQYKKIDVKNRSILKLLFGGNNLQKIVEAQQQFWVNDSKRPADLFTLIRNCIVYQVTQNCQMKIHSFLTKNEQYIILVVKASEKLLQNYAQQKKIQIQVEIGATDPFSFQPVDFYNRPLRLNSYIRDTKFIVKYRLEKKLAKLVTKGMRSENQMMHTSIKKKQNIKLQQGKSSIQTNGLNIFRKGIKMNEDELRASIIIDQMQCDIKLMKIAKTLGLQIVQHSSSNKYNLLKVSRSSWECYYVYNKLLNQNLMSLIKKINGKNQQITLSVKQELSQNTGFILRMIFTKAKSMANYYSLNCRLSTGLNLLSLLQNNSQKQQQRLYNIWDKMHVCSPKSFFGYLKSKKLQIMWRKYQINQSKLRSKFYPAERLIIVNRIIQTHLNIAMSVQKKNIADFYPLHNPYILKNIKLKSYLKSIELSVENNENKENISLIDNDKHNIMHSFYLEYASPDTRQDFLDESIQDRLKMKRSLFKIFSIPTIRFYCGEKLAFYFAFTKQLAQSSYRVVIPAIVIQIIYLAERSEIKQFGQSNLTQFTNILLFIVVIFNAAWTSVVIQEWKKTEMEYTQSFGLTQLHQEDHKREKFMGKFRFNLQADDLNEEYVPKRIKYPKKMFTFVINITYLCLVFLFTLQIFVLKTYLFESNFSENINIVPDLILAVFLKIFKFFYSRVLKILVQFENHKKISDYQYSLISKAYKVEFISSFFSIFLYAFFTQIFDWQYLCKLEPIQDKYDFVYNCDYFVGNQLRSFVLVDIICIIIFSVVPILIHAYKEKKQETASNQNLQFNKNSFESLDYFYEEEDKMSQFMFNKQIDNIWQGYLSLFSVFAIAALFAPAMPLAYITIFVSSVLRLHTQKNTIIFYSKRLIPIKTKPLKIVTHTMTFLSILSIFVTSAYIVYTCDIFKESKFYSFFSLILVLSAIKLIIYLKYKKKKESVAERSKIKVNQFLSESIKTKSVQRNLNKRQNNNLNNDMLNVQYRQNKLKRNIPKLVKAKVYGQSIDN